MRSGRLAVQKTPELGDGRKGPLLTHSRRKRQWQLSTHCGHSLAPQLSAYEPNWQDIVIICETLNVGRCMCITSRRVFRGGYGRLGRTAE
jgi:hypothetical protein